MNKTNINHNDVDLTSNEVQQCPYNAYKTLRDDAPVYQDPKTGFFIVTRYEFVRELLLDTENFSSAFGAAAQKAESNINSDHVMQGVKLFEEKGWIPAPTLAGRDNPNHKEMRSIFDKAFRPSKIKELEKVVENTSYELIDSFIEKGTCDWVKDFSIP